MILNPRFYMPMTIDRRSARHELGLDEHRPTALVLFGGYGSKKMLEIAARLERCESAVQAIFICGRNKRLADELRAKRLRIPHFVEEFTSEIPRYMAMSDFLIGKPGPGCISEAIHMQLPVIVADSAWTLPQERFNVDWVVENCVGVKINGLHQITSAVDQIIDRLPGYHSRAAAMWNRAVFEVVECLQRVLARSGDAIAQVEKQGSVH
jgi:1,2-diacylglycerol 3-beta-galactosyltransferase